MKAFWLVRFLPAVLVIIALFSIVAATQAELIYIGTNFDIEVSTPIDLGESPSLMAVTLTAIGKGGALPVTFDSTFSGAVDYATSSGYGITTSGNLLHQIWEWNWQGQQTPTEDSGSDPVPQYLDTHFLVDDLGTTYFNGPDENTLVQNLGLSGGELRGGFGNYLKGTFAIQDDIENLQQAWNFAYIVAPRGTEVFLNFELSGTDLAEITYADAVTGCSFVVPEPSTLLLLSLGALVLLVKRWR